MSRCALALALIPIAITLGCLPSRHGPAKPTAPSTEEVALADRGSDFDVQVEAVILALRKSAERDPDLETAAIRSLVTAALDLTAEEFSAQERGHYRWEPMGGRIQLLYQSLGAPLWFDLEPEDEAGRIDLARAYYHFAGSPTHERRKAEAAADPEVLRRAARTQPESMIQNLVYWLDVLFTQRAGEFAAWSAAVRRAGAEEGLPSETRGDLLRAALELLRREKLPAGL